MEFGYKELRFCYIRDWCI